MQVSSTQQRMTIVASRLLRALPEKLTAAQHRSSAGLVGQRREFAYTDAVSGADRTAYHASCDDGRHSIVTRLTGRVPVSLRWFASLSTRARAHAEAA
ncbi:hypothetical protein LMG31841_02103 [Paraburkholderia saeva]|uniref:Uncharacterized protein n=1 Tax=Paraburkholderia saeva TaxID=2777537 RepID=A0A9N8RUT3_9BURK|nr:hypothetical protein LMG31841_02103 [Paraburkholderia saeva]